MNKKITNYEDLVEEEQRLKLRLQSHEVLIKKDVAIISEHLKPVGQAYNFIKNITTRDQAGPLTNFGINFGVDVLVRKLVLARAGWVTKIVVPYIIKNYSSHFVTEEQRDKLMKKVEGFMKKIRAPWKNKKHEEDVVPETSAKQESV